VRPIRKLPPFARSGGHGAPWLAATLFSLPGRQLGLALEDVTTSVRGNMLQAAERHALEMLASGAPLAAILEVIARAIETASPGMIASVLLLDVSGTKLKHGAAPSLPAELDNMLEGLAIGPKAGSCGTAMYRRERVIVTDIATDPLWEDYRELVAPFGLRACWSEPIIATDGRVLGAFALYHREPRTPDAAAYELLARAAHVTGIAIERRMLDDQLRALAGKIEAVREEERSTIARDIHDQLGQALTAHKLDIGWLLRRITEPALVAKLEELSHSTDDVIRSVQRIATDLRPGVLDHLGLRAAIEWQAEEFERRSGLTCRVTSSLSNVVLERELTTGVFRIFQEALTNIARHANAKTVEVALYLLHGQLHLDISDDGVGLPEIGLGPHLGILGMRERAVRLGGECVVQRKQPTGVTVSVVLPLRFPPELQAVRD
ncbi:MAG TPA: GAF domain-containing sensor histidine kinase, partial [Kofleriaceae bacterium]|nr:GAF domain-containing sensor histidine kinase [Kofleriaceae bacterium]